MLCMLVCIIVEIFIFFYKYMCNRCGIRVVYVANVLLWFGVFVMVLLKRGGCVCLGFLELLLLMLLGLF